MRKDVIFYAGVIALSCAVATLLWRDSLDERNSSDAPGLRSLHFGARSTAHLAPEPQVAKPASESSPPAADKPEAASRNPRDEADAYAEETPADQSYHLIRYKNIARITQRYPDVAEVLQLSGDEEEQFTDLLDEHLNSEYSLMLARTSDSTTDQAYFDDTTEARKQLSLQLDAAVREQLGESGYARWKTYQEQITGRMAARAHREMLELGGLPLKQGQARTFTDMAIAEELRRLEELAAIEARQPRSRTPLQRHEDLLRQQRDSDRRLLAAASGVLDPQQIAVLQAMLERRLRGVESELRRLRARESADR